MLPRKGLGSYNTNGGVASIGSRMEKQSAGNKLKNGPRFNCKKELIARGM